MTVEAEESLEFWCSRLYAKFARPYAIPLSSITFEHDILHTHSELSGSGSSSTAGRNLLGPMPMTWLRWRLLRPRCCNHLPPISSAPSQCLSRLPFLSPNPKRHPLHAIRPADLARHLSNRPRLTHSTASTLATTALSRLSISNTRRVLLA